MREFKFRVWNTVLKEYVSPNLIIQKDGLLWLENEDNLYEIEQYTGLKDANGKEIYEGDIIKYDGIVYTIVWNEEYMGFDLTRVGNMHLGVPMNVIITCGSVIGNIHENPELLKEK